MRNCDTCARSPMSVKCGHCGTPDYEFWIPKNDSVPRRTVSFEKYLEMNWDVVLGYVLNPHEELSSDLPSKVKKLVDSYLEYHRVEVEK